MRLRSNVNIKMLITFSHSNVDSRLIFIFNLTIILQLISNSFLDSFFPARKSQKTQHKAYHKEHAYSSQNFKEFAAVFSGSAENETMSINEHYDAMMMSSVVSSFFVESVPEFFITMMPPA